MLRKYLDRKNDSAISPVIGTILMIAATVIIAGAVYAAVNIYGGKNTKQNVDAAWKAQALDTNSNGVDDTIKITYLSGPTGVAPSPSALTLSVKLANGTTASPAVALGSWNPGDFQTYTYALPGGGTWFVTVTQGGNTMLDQQIQTKE